MKILKIRFLLSLIGLLLFDSYAFSQKKFNQQQLDSIVQVFIKQPASQQERYLMAKDIESILPRVESDSVKLLLLTRKALLYGTNIQDQPQVLKSHLEAKDIVYKINGSDQQKIMIHLALAETYMYLKMYDLGMEHLEKSQNIIKTQKDDENLTTLSFALKFMKADLLYMLKKYDKCIEECKMMIEKWPKFAVPEHKSMALLVSNQYTAMSLVEQKKYNDAEHYFKKALESEKYSLPDQLYRIYNSYARLLIETNRSQEAKQLLNKFPLGDSVMFAEEAITRFGLLSKLYVKEGNLKKFEYYDKKKDSLDRAYKVVEMKAVEEAQKYAEDKHIEKIGERNLIIWILIPLVLVAFIFVVYYKLKKDRDRKRYEAIINQLNKEAENKEEELLTADEENIENQNKEVATPILRDDIEKELVKNLQKFEEKEKFLDSNLSVSTMASALKTNRTYLTEVIKKHRGKNFNMYINELRINYIIRKLYNHPEYRSYKISYLAEECGFSSHSTFATIFKSVLNISPSTFIQNLKNDEEK